MNDILLAEVSGCRVQHDVWPAEPVLLPVKAALNHPPQDPRPFRLELLLELSIGVGGLAGERHDIEPAPCGVVHRSIVTS